MRGAALAAVWLVVCAQVAAGAAPLPPPTYVSECRTVWEHETNSSFVSLMNRCLAPDSQSTVPLTIVAQIQQWLQVRHRFAASPHATQLDGLTVLTGLAGPTLHAILSAHSTRIPLHRLDSRGLHATRSARKVAAHLFIVAALASVSVSVCLLALAAFLAFASPSRSW